LALITPDQFEDLLTNNIPMLDVRAPIEFNKGALPSAVNVPILNDAEREQVGRCYNKQGQEAAIALGHQLVSGDIKAARIAAWANFLRAHPEAVLYCFRGGQRSRLAQQWLTRQGLDIPRIAGGYKAIRRLLVDAMQHFAQPQNIVIVGGRTGTGKTRVIDALDPALDLEGFANHRGSAFGRHLTPQPCQVDFENRLAIGLLKLRRRHPGAVALEDEGRLIGCVSLTPEWVIAMKQAAMVVVDETRCSRIQVVIDEYVTSLSAEYLCADAAAGWLNYSAYMLGSVDRIQKRLGGTRHAEVRAKLEDALATGPVAAEAIDFDRHARWIEPLLVDYYDRMYDYQRQQKPRKVLFKGARPAVIEFLQARL